MGLDHVRGFLGGGGFGARPNVNLYCGCLVVVAFRVNSCENASNLFHIIGILKTLSYFFVISKSCAHHSQISVAVLIIIIISRRSS